MLGSGITRKAPVRGFFVIRCLPVLVMAVAVVTARQFNFLAVVACEFIGRTIGIGNGFCQGIQVHKVIFFDEIEERRVSKYEDKESKLDLEICLQRVEPQTREMIKLKYYIGYKLEEIAEILNVPVGTVKGKMYSALKDMKKELEVK